MDDNDIGSEGMTSDSVEMWLEEIAETEGLSREETLEDLVSSYWRLEEIFHLLQDTDIDLDRSPDSAERRDVASENDLEELRKRVNRIAREVEKSEPSADSIEGIQNSVSSLDNRLETSEEQLSEISGELSALLEGPLGVADELADRLTTLEKRMNRLESNVSRVDDRIEGVAESAVTEPQFDAYIQEVGSAQEKLGNEQQSMKELIRNEFGNIRTILTHLLETSGDTEERISQGNQEFERDVRMHLEEEAAVASILRLANREGIRMATCSHCDHSVDLSLLEDPACPTCEREFRSLESRPQYWGLSKRHVLKVEDESTD